jgi:hypothetical protein
MVEFFRLIVSLVLNKPQLVLGIVADYVGQAYAVPLRKKIVGVSSNYGLRPAGTLIERKNGRSFACPSLVGWVGWDQL